MCRETTDYSMCSISWRSQMILVTVETTMEAATQVDTGSRFIHDLEIIEMFSATECQALGGSSLGSCASGFGVCCTMTGENHDVWWRNWFNLSFSGNCGSSSSLNNSYFSYFSGDTSPCQFKVCKSESNICQIRLDFDTFVVEQPNTNVASATSDAPAGKTEIMKFFAFLKDFRQKYFMYIYSGLEGLEYKVSHKYK